MTEISWPQPHEGITGTGRPGWLLSLDDKAVPYRDAIIVLARHLQNTVLVGQPAPVVRRMGDRMRHPRVGDLVVTNMALMTRDPDTRLKGLGILIHAGRKEWYETDTEWEAFCATERTAACENHSGAEAGEIIAYTTGEDNRATDTAFYVQYGPDAGDVCRWVNEMCTMVPVDVDSFSVDAAAERTGTNAIFTEDSLTGVLADSGFELRVPADRKDG